MPTVIVRVNDRPYNMVCDEGEEEHLTELAELVASEVEKLKKSFGQVGDSKLLMMASLVVADKLDEALKRIETLVGEVDDLRNARSAAIERSKMLETTVAEKLVNAAERLEHLSEQLSETSG